MKKKILVISFVVFTLLSAYFFINPIKRNKLMEKNTHYNSAYAVYEEKELKQQFYSNFETIDTIELSFNNEKKFDGMVVLSLYDNDKLLVSKDYSYEDVLNEDKISFDVNLDNTLHKNYYFTIECNDCDEKHPLYLATGSEVENEEVLIVNNEKTDIALNYNISGLKVDYIISICFLLITFVIAGIYFYLYTKKKILKKKKYYYIVYFFISLIMSFLTYYLLIKNYYSSSISILLLLLLYGFGIAFVYIFSKLFNMKKIAKEQLYLLIVIPVSLFYLIFMLPGNIPDEPAHFNRAYDLIESSQNSKIPQELSEHNVFVVTDYSNYEEIKDDETNYNDLATTGEIASGYNPILYVFSMIGIFIGKVLSLPIFITYYLARLCNLIGMIVCGYYIIKLLPFGKTIGLVYLLNPMYIHQGISTSADMMVNSICLLFISTILYLKNKKEDFSYKDLILLGSMIILLCLAKYIYIPLILLLFLLSKKIKNTSKKNKAIIYGSITVSMLLCVYFVIDMFILPMSSSGGVEITNVGNISPKDQLLSILKNPFSLVFMYARTILGLSTYHIKTFFGVYLGWLNINVFEIFTWIYAGLLLSSPFLEKEENILTKKEKIWLNIFTIFMILVIILFFYLSWSEVGSNVALGVQGRYYIPILILPLLTLINKNRHLEFKYPNLIVLVSMLMVHFAIAYILFLHFV